MLPEGVLEELARDTALRQHLVEMAWPSLSTESRLQVLQAIQGVGVWVRTPSWLTKLALDDPAPVVRYWAARHTYFKNGAPEQFEDGEERELLAASHEDKALYAKAAADDSQFVRFCTREYAMRTGGDYMGLTSASQLERLVFIRRQLPDLRHFIEWLEEAVARGVPDRELRDCAEEFFMLPWLQEDFKREPSEFRDGSWAYRCGEGMRRGWALTKKAGPGLRLILSYALPTSYGRTTMPVDELARLPDDVVETFFCRADPSEEMFAVVKLIHDDPERFPPKIREALLSPHNPRWIGREEAEERRRRSAVSRQEATLETVLDLKRQVTHLQEVVRNAANRKRGFFG
jgi:hypothetical protein